MKRIFWFIFVFFCLAIGLYPFSYFFIDRSFGLLQFKSPALLSDTLWNIGFYAHIIPGAIALLIGWTQFVKKWRKEKLDLHRILGKIYLLTVLVSGVAGLYIAQTATGGIVSRIGFSTLAILWLGFSYMAYSKVKAGDILGHQKMMIVSYALCCSAVSLRIFLPLLAYGFSDFILAYKIVAWLCWVPNLIIAYIINLKGPSINS